jgi:hypothetical protein
MADVNKTIQIKIEAQTKALEEKLRRIPGITEEQVQKMSAEMREHFRKTEEAAARSSKRIGASFKKAGQAMATLGAGVAVAGAGVIAFGQHLADLSNELVDASTKTGLTVENLGGLRLAAEGAGVAFAQLEPGLIKLQDAIVKASEGSGPAADAFQRLGISATNAEGELRSADDVFNEITATLAQVENQTEKNALAMDIFGKAAGPALLQSGALDNMQAFNNLASEFGINMAENSSQMGLFQRAMAEIQLVLQGVGAQLLSTVTGTADLSDGLFKISDGIVYFGSLAGDVIGAVIANFSLMSRSVEAVLTSISGLGMATVKVFEGDFGAAAQLAQNAISETGQVIQAMGQDVDAILNLGNAFDKASSKVSDLQKLRKEIIEQSAAQAQADQRAARAAQDLASAQENLKPPKEDDSAAKEQAKALEELLAIRQQAVEALMTEEELEQIQFEQRLARIEELKEMTGAVEEAELAAIAVRDDMEAKAHKRNMDRIAEETAARRSFVSTLTSSATAAANAIESVLVDTGKITKEQALKLHFLKQTAALTDIAVNTAVAITKANATLGPIAGGIATGALVASGAAQAAAVIAQPPPTFDMGGLIGNMDPLRPGETIIRAQRGEAVLDESTVNRLGGERGVAALQRGEMGGPQVVVISPFKHLDRYNRSALRRQSVLTRQFKPIGSGAY